MLYLRPRGGRLSDDLVTASARDAAEIAALRNQASNALTERFGPGHWSGQVTERGVLAGMRKPAVFVRRGKDGIEATLRLATRKPWAIDVSYFSAAGLPLYLTDMAVRPGLQRRGIGRRCMEAVPAIARAWTADAIRLDAYDADAGAGGFYAKCGYREVGRVVYRGTPLIYFEALI